jgi:hypothetical protein
MAGNMQTETENNSYDCVMKLRHHLDELRTDGLEFGHHPPGHANKSKIQNIY